MEIPEFIVASSTGKVALLSRNQASGNAVALAQLASTASAGQSKRNQITAENLDWSAENSKTIGSTGDIHDATISREHKGSKDEKRVAFPSPSIRIIFESQYDTITGLIVHPSQPRFVVGGHSGKDTKS